MWGEDEDASEHDYYNSIPGKEPPVGGVVDSRLKPSGALLGHIHTQPQNKTGTQVRSMAVETLFHRIGGFGYSFVILCTGICTEQSNNMLGYSTL